MTPALANAASPVPWTAWLVRWLVFLVVALDMVSAPLHAHAHDFGPDMLLAQDHFGVAALDAQPHAQAPRLAGPSHSVAALRVEVEQTFAAPSLDLLVAAVATLQPQVRASIEAPPGWRQDVDHIPIPRLSALRPEGRAPPSPLRC